MVDVSLSFCEQDEKDDFGCYATTTAAQFFFSDMEMIQRYNMTCSEQDRNVYVDAQ